MTNPTFPEPESGPDLAELRRSLGISQEALGAKMDPRRSRQTIIAWEQTDRLPALKALAYRKALMDLVEAAPR
jgi:DNA-binding XRE family transcriptional regulator